MADDGKRGRTRVTIALLVGSAAATAAVFALMRGPEAVMSERGHGIVGYELAFSAERAQVILDSWSEAGQAAARRSLLLDFAFIPCYAVFFASLAALSLRGAPVAAGLRRLAPALPAIAGVCDAVENVSLLLILGSAGSRDALSVVAGSFACVKFGLLALVFLSSLVSMAWRLLKRRSEADRT